MLKCAMIVKCCPRFARLRLTLSESRALARHSRGCDYMKLFLRKNFAFILILLAVFLGGWQLGFAGFQFNLELNPPSLKIENKRITSGSIDFSPLWDVLEGIN